MTVHFNKIVSPSPKDALCHVWLKLAQWFWRRRFLNFVKVFSLLCSYLPLGKGVAIHLNKLEFPILKDTLCQVSLKLAQWFWRRRFLNFVNVFSLFVIISPLKRAGPIICQVWLKLVQWFWRRFLNFVNVFLLFHNYMYLPLKKDVALQLNKLESPLHKDALWKVWLKLAQWF